MAIVMNASLVQIDSIQVPEGYRRKPDLVEDDKLRNSIQQGEIQVPLVVSRLSNQDYVLIDGYRRLAVAKSLGMAEVPCVIDEIPTGVLPEEYRNRVRFILDEHRQDLLPSQRASLINTLKEKFRMNNREVGVYLGVDPSTIGTWLLVDKLIPAIVVEVDRGNITLHAARAFEGMTPEGQQQVWQEQQSVFRDQKGWSAIKVHKHIRESYPPDKSPNLYQRPEQVLEKMRRPRKNRQAKKRQVIGQPQKDSLLKDLDLLQAELRENHAEIDRLKREIEVAAPIIESILLNDSLLNMVPEQMRAEIEEFGESRL